MAVGAVFVGRKQELAELDRALSAALDGRGELVLIAGEPGIGKTTLCTSFAEQARRRGVRALWGRAWEFGGAPPFWPWVQVLRALEGEAAEEGTARNLLGASGGSGGAGAPFGEGGASDRFALFDAVTERLRGAAATAPIAILLEDLHAADLPSLLLLRFAVEQLRDARVIVVGTRRTVEASLGPEAAALIAELSRVARAIDLHGLATAELAELIAHHAPDRAAEFSLALHDRTSGNPLLAAALLQPGSQTETDDGVPLRARAAIEQRVLRLPAPVREVLSAAAVIGREVALLLLAKVCDRPLDQVLEHVRVLIAEQVLIERAGTPGRYGFRHGLFREVVYAALSPSERLRLHRAAGHALEALYGGQRDAHLPELARHFLAVYPDAERGVEYAAGAAAQALRALAYEDAAEHYAHALAAVDSAGPAQGGAGALWIGLAEAQAASGQRAQARESYRTAHRIAIERGEPALQARAAIGFSRMAGFGRSDDEALSWLERALEVTREPAARVRVLAALIDRIWPKAKSTERVDAISGEMLALAQSSGDQRLQAEALAATLVMSWVPDPQRFAQHYARSAELFALAESLGDLELRVEAHRWRFTACMIQGDVAEAKRVLDGYERLAERAARPQLRFNALLRRTMLAVMEGRFDDGERLLPGLERAARRAGDDQGEYLITSFRYQLCRARGDKAGLRAAFQHFCEVVGNDMPALVVTALAAPSHALLGDRAEAYRALDAYLELASREPAGAMIAVASAALACWQLGDGERARRLRPRLVPSEDLVLMGGVVDFYGPGALYLGLLAATAGEHAQAERDLEKAVAALDRLGARYHAAVARNALAHVLAHGAPARAAALREQAQAAARELGGVSLLDPPQPAAPHAASAPVATPAAPATSADAVFYVEGEYYTIGLGGSVVRVRCSRGLELIERLLRCEGAEVHVLELAGSALDDRGGEGALLDERAKAAYRARAEALREELAEAERFGDAGRALRAREELDALAAQLAQATGLHGRDRAGGIAERARARVTLAIRRAIKGLERVHPALAAHLDAAIETGTFCVYRPDPRACVTWRFQPPVAS